MGREEEILDFECWILNEEEEERVSEFRKPEFRRKRKSF